MTSQDGKLSWERLYAVWEKLPGGVEVNEVRMCEKTWLAERIYMEMDLYDGIESAAAALGVQQLNVCAFKDGGIKKSFTYGGVSIVQYEAK